MELSDYICDVKSVYVLQQYSDLQYNIQEHRKQKDVDIIMDLRLLCSKEQVNVLQQ